MLNEIEIPVKIVSERVGHKSAKLTLDLYGHLLDGRQERAVEAHNQVLFEDEN